MIAFHRSCFPDYIPNFEEKFKCQVCLEKKPKKQLPKNVCIFCRRSSNDTLLMSQDEKKKKVWSHLLCRGLYFLSIPLTRDSFLYDSLCDFINQYVNTQKQKHSPQQKCKICSKIGFLVECSSCRSKQKKEPSFYHPICAIVVRDSHAVRPLRGRL